MYKIYDITNIGAAYFLKWLEENITGATRFHSVANNINPQTVEINPEYRFLTAEETRQELMEKFIQDHHNGKLEEATKNIGEELSTLTNTDTLENIVMLTENNAPTIDNGSTVLTDNTVDIANKTWTLDNVNTYLYTLTDEKLVGMWLFAEKIIYVIEED